MTRLRLYLDEDSMDLDLVRALRARGLDVVTAVEEGMAGQSDQANLDHAARQGRVLVTFNVRDFYALHTEALEAGRPHAGLVFAQQQRYSVGEQMRRLLRLAASRSAEEMHGRAEFLSVWT